MKNRKKTKSIVIVAAISLTLILLVVVSSSPDSGLHGFYKIFAAPLSTVQSAFSNWGTSLKNGFDMLFHSESINEEMDRLREENAALSDAAREREILERQNEELKEMLGYQERYDEFDVIVADVIAGDISEMFNTFTINRGTSDGIEEGSFVIAPEGLVGIISVAGPVSSKVMAISDEQNKLIARILDNNEIVRVVGTYTDESSDLLKVDRILSDTVIEEGDVLVTANSGGVYPYGIVVGTVKEVGVDETTGSRYAIAEPAVNFRTLSSVFVMTPKKGMEDILPSPEESGQE